MFQFSSTYAPRYRRSGGVSGAIWISVIVFSGRTATSAGAMAFCVIGATEIGAIVFSGAITVVALSSATAAATTRPRSTAVRGGRPTETAIGADTLRGAASGVRTDVTVSAGRCRSAATTGACGSGSLRRVRTTARRMTAAAASAQPRAGSRKPETGSRESEAVSCVITRARRSAGGSTSSISRTARSIASSNLAPRASRLASDIGIPHRRHLLLQHLSRFRHAPLHRADRDLQHLSNLFVAVVTRARQQQRVAQFLRQRGDERLEPALQIGGHHVLFLRLAARRQPLHRIPLLAAVPGGGWRHQTLHP